MMWQLKNYVSKVLNSGEVKANNCGRPINSVAVHPHVEFLITRIIIILIIMEAVLEQREKTLSEIAHDVYTETGSYYAVASIF